MLDFLIWEVWRVQIVPDTWLNVGAIVVAAIITGGLAYFGGSRKSYGELKDSIKDSFNGQINLSKDLGNGLSKEHNDLLNEHKAIDNKLNEIKDDTGIVSDILKEERIKHELRYASLSDAQKDLKISAEKIGLFASEFEKMANELEVLKQENRSLKLKMQVSQNHLRADSRQDLSDEEQERE